MMPRREEPVLSPEDQADMAVEGRLLEVGQRFEEGLRERVIRLLLSSAEAILKLADLDLVRHEADEEQGGHTLALWEELAPVMGSTVGYVNELIAKATEQFPPPPEKEGFDGLDDAFGPAKPESEQVDETPQTTEGEIAQLVSAVCSGMRRDVAHLG